MKKLSKDLVLGILAGVAIALGGLLNILVKSLLNNVNSTLATFVGALLFPIGLTLVCFFGYNLFTGKIGYVLDNKPNYLLFLLIIYIGNIIGSLIIGIICHIIFQYVPQIYDVVLKTATNKMNSVTSFLSGMKTFGFSCLCGMLVYLAVFCYKTFEKKILKIIGIFIPIAIFVYFGFDHCVANMFYFSFAFSFASWHSYLNIIIATLGNSAGAILLNGVINLIKKSS